LSLKIEYITSDKNTRIKDLLFRKDELFVFEGEKLVMDIMRKEAVPDLLIVNKVHQEVYELVSKKGIPVWEVTEKVMKKLSSLKNPPSMIAIYEQIPTETSIFRNSMVIAVDTFQDPGNLGSIFRCAAAFGIRSIALVGECVRLTNTKFLRAAQNSVFYPSVKRFDSLEGFLTEAIEKKFNIYLTSSHRTGSSILIKDVMSPAVIVLGNEGRGVNDKFLNEHPVISIRQTDLVESLNAGISGCILMNLVSEHLALIE